MDLFSFFSSLIRAMLNDDVIRSIGWIEAAWEKWFAHPYMPSSENWNEMMTHKNHWEIVRKTDAREYASEFNSSFVLSLIYFVQFNGIVSNHLFGGIANESANEPNNTLGEIPGAL